MQTVVLLGSQGIGKKILKTRKRFTTDKTISMCDVQMQAALEVPNDILLESQSEGQKYTETSKSRVYSLRFGTAPLEIECQIQQH